MTYHMLNAQQPNNFYEPCQSDAIVGKYEILYLTLLAYFRLNAGNEFSRPGTQT